MPIKLKIDVTKIDKSALFNGKKGIYLDLVLWETPNDQYENDYRVVQDIPRERRDAGEKGEILGNGKNFGDSKKRPAGEATRRPAAPPPTKRPPADPDLDAPDDDIPF